MIILGIETSCDETAVCVIHATGNLEKPAFKVLGNTTLSQVNIHAKHGGVFPMLAKREHTKNLIPILEEVLRESNFFKSREKVALGKDKEKTISKILEREPGLAHDLIKVLPSIERPKIDAIAVTYGPGLEPALWVGINFAKALGVLWDIEVCPVNHMEGHIASVLLNEKSRSTDSESRMIKFPVLALLISGGHTELVFTEKWGKYKILGETRDDAVGEAYDKVGRMLGIPYPAGPRISRLTTEDRIIRKIANRYDLPRPMINSDNLDFSFSGLKTSVLYALKKVPKIDEVVQREMAREFEDAVVDVFVSKTRQAIEKCTPKTFIIGGGVSANISIQNALTELCKKMGIEIFVPQQNLSTDNALMIAMAGFINILVGNNKTEQDIKANGNLRLA